MLDVLILLILFCFIYYALLDFAGAGWRVNRDRFFPTVVQLLIVLTIISYLLKII